MSKILMAAINSSYSHTNIAVRSIALYCNKIKGTELIDFCEWTINQPVGEILRGIESKNPSILLFSAYIWNIEVIQKILPDIKKIIPNCILGLGGPEVSFNAREVLEKMAAVDFIVCGEGERTVFEICKIIEENEEILSKKDEFYKELFNVKGVFLRNYGFSGERELICNLSELPFPYPEFSEPDNKIFYYESSRGCPFSCAYCMSSLDTRVRFMPVERVFLDLQKFLDANVRLVKFVDRTYNLNEERYISIWKYILENHNKKTMFHFEIEAEYLSQKALDFLQKIPAGMMQFEIGVQSANPKTLKTVGRSENTKTLAANIKQIPKTIHSHLDLIAGLPYEDLKSFGHSFDFVMDLKPDALQLGFLKVLHGTVMKKFSEKNGWQWMENPPYEILLTPYLSYSDIVFLKDIEIMVDAFWNSGDFLKSMDYIGRIMGFWNFFCSIVKQGRKSGTFNQMRRDVYWFGFLFDHAAVLSEKIDEFILRELLRFDFISAKKNGRFPDWYDHRYDRDGHTLALQNNGGIHNSRLDYAYSDYEEFFINPLADFPEKTLSKEKSFKILFIYPRREKDNLNGKHYIKKQILL